MIDALDGGDGWPFKQEEWLLRPDSYGPRIHAVEAYRRLHGAGMHQEQHIGAEASGRWIASEHVVISLRLPGVLRGQK